MYKICTWSQPMTRPARPSTLPAGTAPRGFNREQSAEYIGVSPTKFDELVADGRMPKPKRIDGRVVWDRLQLDIMFAALPDAEGRGDIWSRPAV
jgi:predicted DNA-binding transcriptional regulator AlpA